VAVLAHGALADLLDLVVSVKVKFLFVALHISKILKILIFELILS
jgi:hypothetical protein